MVQSSSWHGIFEFENRINSYSGATMQRNDQKYVIFSKKVQKAINFGTFWWNWVAERTFYLHQKSINFENVIFFVKRNCSSNFFQKHYSLGFSGGPADERGVKICSRHVSSRFDSVVLVRGDFGSTCPRALRSSEK